MGFEHEKVRSTTPTDTEEFLSAYEELKLGRILAEEVILMRRHRGLTQKELAQRLGTKQSSISRLESRKTMPNLRFLKQVADALDAELMIEFVPRESLGMDDAAAG